MTSHNSNPDQVRLAVVLATYNEAESLPELLEHIADSLETMASRGIESRILLFDDRSPDGTAQIATQAAQRLGMTLELHSANRRGLGAAYLRAFRELSSRGDIDLVVTMDADGQHDGRVIADLVEHLTERDLDLVIGSRWTRGGAVPGLTAYRRLLSRIGNLAFRTVTGIRSVRDASNSFRVSRLEVIRNFDPSGLSLDGYSIMTSYVAAAISGGFRVDEFPITFHPRSAGESKLKARDVFEFARNLLSLRKKVKSLAEPVPMRVAR